MTIVVMIIVVLNIMTLVHYTRPDEELITIFTHLVHHVQNRARGCHGLNECTEHCTYPGEDLIIIFADHVPNRARGQHDVIMFIFVHHVQNRVRGRPGGGGV